MAERQYIGARYVIKIYENSADAGSAEWEANTNYEPLILVTYNNGSYLSKKQVPATVGNPASNTDYWVQTGFYNGQIASLQSQIDDINDNKLPDVTSAIQTLTDAIDSLGNPIVTIAPSDAPEFIKKNATYVCTGTNDQLIINNAIQQMTAGGEIHLMAGLFNVSTPIIVDRDLTISGEGCAIGGRPEYTATNGIPYGQDSAGYYQLRQNLYGTTDGRNTCIRTDVDISVIVCETTSDKINVCFKDFFISGYGRDRSSHAGIDILCRTDVSLIEHVSIIDCYVGIYAYGLESDNTYGYCDCLWISKCSLQQCGIGIIARCNSSYISDNCIADNIGAVNYRVLSAINSGGIYIDGERNSILNNQCVYADLYCSNPCAAIRVLSKESRVVDNICTFLNGCGIRIEAYAVQVLGNRLNYFGWSNTAGNNMGIDIKENVCDVQNNYIGSTQALPSPQVYACNYYGIASSRPLTYHKTNVSNNVFFNIITTAVDTSTLLGSTGTLNNVNNVEWSYL